MLSFHWVKSGNHFQLSLEASNMISIVSSWYWSSLYWLTISTYLLVFKSYYRSHSLGGMSSMSVSQCESHTFSSLSSWSRLFVLRILACFWWSHLFVFDVHACFQWSHLFVFDLLTCFRRSHLFVFNDVLACFWWSHLFVFNVLVCFWWSHMFVFDVLACFRQSHLFVFNVLACFW